MAKDESFGLAEVVYQIAILFGSVAILGRSRKVVTASLVFGVIAVPRTLDAFFLLMRLH
jgi:hypothetical protein